MVFPCRRGHCPRGGDVPRGRGVAVYRDSRAGVPRGGHRQGGVSGGGPLFGTDPGVLVLRLSRGRLDPGLVPGTCSALALALALALGPGPCLRQNHGVSADAFDRPFPPASARRPVAAGWVPGAVPPVRLRERVPGLRRRYGVCVCGVCGRPVPPRRNRRCRVPRSAEAVTMRHRKRGGERLHPRAFLPAFRRPPVGAWSCVVSRSKNCSMKRKGKIGGRRDRRPSLAERLGSERKSPRAQS